MNNNNNYYYWLYIINYYNVLLAAQPASQARVRYFFLPLIPTSTLILFCKCFYYLFTVFFVKAMPFLYTVPSILMDYNYYNNYCYYPFSFISILSALAEYRRQVHGQDPVD